MKKNVNRIMLLMGMWLMLTFLFFCPENVKAKSLDTIQNAPCIMTNDGMLLIDQEVPEEVKNPIDKGLSLIVYLVIVSGIMIFLVGLVLLAITFLGHQQDMLMKGILALGAGALLAAGPFIAEWIFGIDIV